MVRQAENPEEINLDEGEGEEMVQEVEIDQLQVPDSVFGSLSDRNSSQILGAHQRLKQGRKAS
jgi:hypothetical protein